MFQNHFSLIHAEAVTLKRNIGDTEPLGFRFSHCEMLWSIALY